MSSEESSSDDEPFSTSRLRGLLKQMHNDITKTIDDLVPFTQPNKKHSSSLSTQHPLTQSAQEFFQQPTASVKEMMKILIPKWKEEGRIHLSGRSVQLSEEESALFKKSGSLTLHELLRELRKMQVRR